MCLVVDGEKTEKMYSKTGSITVWKVYELIDGSLYSPLFGNRPIENLVISDRIVQRFSNDEMDEYHKRHGVYGLVRHDVYRGIHVILNRESAREYKKALERNWTKNDHKKFIIVRCTTDMTYFVAAGGSFYCLEKFDNGAVFMRMHISSEDVDKALNGDFR